jgi:hypothetical protein
MVDLDHGLHLVGDDVPGGEDVVHPIVAAAHAVAGADDAKLHRGAAGLEDALPDALGHLAQVVVARIGPVPAVGDADHGPGQVVVAVAHPFIKGADAGPDGTGQELLTPL